MGQKKNKKSPSSDVMQIPRLREIVGCIVVVGLLTVAIVLALRVPPDKQAEILRTVLSLLSVVIVALYGGQRGGKSK